MANFYAVYPASSSGGGGGGVVTQGTTPWVDNVSQFGGANVVTGTGVGGAGIPRVTVSSDSFPATQPVSGTVAVSNFPATQPISGTVTANAGTGNFTVVQPTGSSLHVAVDSMPTTTVTGSVSVSNFPATQPVSGTVAATQSGTWNITNVSGTVSLPTGASTSASQTTGNNSLASIDTKTPALGQALMAASSPVVIASNQSSLPNTPISTAMAYSASGSMAFGTITNAYTTVLTTSAASRIVFVFNSFNQPIAVSLDGTSDSFLLEVGDECSVDLGPSNLNLPTSSTIKAKYTGSAPTVGTVRVSVVG